VAEGKQLDSEDKQSLIYKGKKETWLSIKMKDTKTEPENRYFYCLLFLPFPLLSPRLNPSDITSRKGVEALWIPILHSPVSEVRILRVHFAVVSSCGKKE